MTKVEHLRGAFTTYTPKRIQEAAMRDPKPSKNPKNSHILAPTIMERTNENINLLMLDDWI